MTRIRSALVLALVLLTAGFSLPAGAAPAVPQARPGTYLALGDSLTTGYQPGRGDAVHRGYVGPVAAGMARRGQPVRIRNLACTGETTQTMIEGGRCTYRQGSQLAAARAALARDRSTRLITLTIGANDVRRCLQGTQINAPCTQRTLRQTRARLEVILGSLREAAPQAQIVVLDYYNPYLATHLLGNEGRLVAASSTLLHTQLNSAVRNAATGAGGSVAYVSSGFNSTSFRYTRLSTWGRVPVRVAQICTLTWMCNAADIHPNDTGYAVLAAAVLDAVDARSGQDRVAKRGARADSGSDWLLRRLKRS
ncbi:SGNH/GDSL hydrolase family protein [Gephyromycinifex aptenodytis]|uniref:SGNH/GDSL hydrolase family protein n=1 Tax=Gephyromycinifex aptenodytis TaxID=2716227 RepID=UPI001445E00A|nr:GDSL-type esterase/lipase family protein [Gephyromycinifex aptenodytis]